MELEVNALNLISALGAVQCALVAVALLTIKKGNVRANRFFGLFLLSLGYLILDLTFYDTHLFLRLPYLYPLSGPIDFLIFPPFYFFIRSAINPDSRLKAVHLLHYLPFVLILAGESHNFFKSPDGLRELYLSDLSAVGQSSGYYVSTAILYGYLLAYLLVCARLVWNISGIRDKGLNDKALSTIVSFKWLLMILIAITVCSLSFDLLASPGNNFDNYVTPILLTALVYLVSFMGIRQSEIVFAQSLFQGDQKYRKSALTDDRAEEYLKRLNQCVREDKVYLDSDLSLSSLARRLRLTPHLLSQLLNQYEEKNFPTYIRELRINEAKRLLRDPENSQFTILEIAYKVGFNSLSAFNTAFKNLTGVPPSTFRKDG